MRAPQIFLFLGLACPSIRDAQRGSQFPGGSDPPQCGQLSGGPSQRHALVLGCPRAAWERRQEI